VHLAVHLAMPGFTCQWVSFPLRDITRKQRRFFAEPPTLHFAPSSGFHSLSTVSSALELAGLFHPAATSRVLFRSGASLPPQPPFLIGRSLPPCRCCIAAPTHGPTFAGSPVSPRATPLDFEASICARPRSSGPVIHLARSRSPLRISRSSRVWLSRRRQPLSRSPSAHDVTRSVFRKNFHLSTSTSAKQLRGTHSPSSPGQVREAVLVQYPCPFDHLAMTELGVALLTVTRTFRCVDQRAESRTRRLVVSRPRASCDAGLLMPRCVSRASHTLADARRLARSSSSHLAMLRRLPDDRASSPIGRSRSVLVLRRSRRACLHGACTCARLATFACTTASGSGPSSASRFRAKRPSALSLRVHDQELLVAYTSLVPAVLASRRPRATLHRLTAHGLANSCHVSTSAGDDPLPFEDRARTSHPTIAPALASRR
jgi:hypothetical protein